MVNSINGHKLVSHLNWQQPASQVSETEAAAVANNSQASDSNVQSGASIFQQLPTELQALLLQQQSGHPPPPPPPEGDVPSGSPGHGQTIGELLKKLEDDLLSEPAGGSASPVGRRTSAGNSVAASSDTLMNVADQVTQDLVDTLQILQNMRSFDQADGANSQDSLQIMASQIAQNLIQQLQDWRNQSSANEGLTVNQAVSVTL